MPIAWIPSDLPQEISNQISYKSLNILTGEQGKVPESLAVVPFPTLKLKGLIKTLEIKDATRRGGAIDSAITVVFKEDQDSVFYKYINSFEDIFTKASTKIVKLEEAKADKELIKEELMRFHTQILYTLDELYDLEMSLDEQEEFPASAEESEMGEARFKIVVCGDPQVGKTSTVLRFTDRSFRRTYIMTLGVNVTEKFVRMKNLNVTIKFVIWDIAGQEKFGMMRRHFYEGADGMLLIFDLTRPETFQNIKKWYKDIKTHIKKELHGFILGNKSDLFEERKVFHEEISNLAKELSLAHFETSALTGRNVDKAFYKLGEKLVNALKKD